MDSFGVFVLFLSCDTPTVAPAKAALDSAKQIQGSHPLKHQLPIIESSLKTKLRHDGLLHLVQLNMLMMDLP
ncbi:hypothetical protein NC653_022482 [Populus alba x Populus x berolinensis]|uniref:Uncharacterized protein n=1 Tax=Populus alba x Populus x berolinensis TaxID=444605 RepID=A0AAD6MFK3_9ROSI|nr:hypothetical protein NC653_022482 [Populus alba x Populus x berolinensis]